MMFTRKLTEDQRQQWERDGYFVLPDALTSHEVVSLTQALDQLYQQHVVDNPEADAAKGMDRRNVMEDDDAFVELMDHPGILGVVVDLLGPYIQLSMSEAVIRLPDPEFKGYIHTDGGQALQHIRLSDTSWPLQLKIQYFLTDVLEPNGGNFTLVPGSHRQAFPEEGLPDGPESPGTVQLSVKAGDAAIFTHAIWHGPARNLSGKARKTLIYCYSQQCFRPFDYKEPSPGLLARCTPRQRRLLGDLGADWRPGAYFYSPSDQVEVLTGAATPADG